MAQLAAQLEDLHSLDLPYAADFDDRLLIQLLLCIAAGRLMAWFIAVEARLISSLQASVVSWFESAPKEKRCRLTRDVNGYSASERRLLGCVIVVVVLPRRSAARRLTLVFVTAVPHILFSQTSSSIVHIQAFCLGVSTVHISAFARLDDDE